ncbi:MAG: hypothetical protein ACLUI3_12405 [Christensenellales bacterium]
MHNRLFSLLLALSLLPCAALGESLTLDEMNAAEDATPLSAAEAAQPVESAARAVLSTESSRWPKRFTRGQRPAPARAIQRRYHVCKNYTVHLFRETCGDFRMAEYPDVPLVIPNNQKKADCALRLRRGMAGRARQRGQPVLRGSVALRRRVSKAENRENAREFLKQVQRGDYFQMAADYYYGVGAHSMLFIADYDPETDSVHWADSNMKGKSVNGVRYAYVQYDAVKPIDWFVDAFCRKKYGATIYRLRDDIVYAE